MDEAEAKQAVRRQLLGPLRHSLRVGYDGQSWELHGKSLKVHAEIDAAVEKALAESRDGGLPTRLVRYVTGGSLDKQVAADVSYSQPAINRFVRRVAHEVDREAAGRDDRTDRRLARSRGGKERPQAARQAAHPPARGGGA